MAQKITITVPDNCELRKDGNVYTIIEKEKKKLTYNDVIKKLYPHTSQKIIAEHFNSVQHLQKIIAIIELTNVAKYLNGDWQPDWNDAGAKYCININNDEIGIDFISTRHYGDIYFRSKELAQQAIEILGEGTVKCALCTDY